MLIETMLYVLILITILLLTVTQFILIISIRHPEHTTKYLALPKKSLLPRIILGISILTFFILLFLFLWKLSSPQPMSGLSVLPASPTVTPTLTAVTIKGVRHIEHEEYKTEDTDYYLYTDSDKSKPNLETVALKIKDITCKKLCTINFYDEGKAYVLDRLRKTIPSRTAMQKWNEENYVYVANHYLGYLNSAQYSSFFYYPYKDLYYQNRTEGK